MIRIKICDSVHTLLQTTLQIISPVETCTDVNFVNEMLIIFRTGYNFNEELELSFIQGEYKVI